LGILIGSIGKDPAEVAGEGTACDSIRWDSPASFPFSFRLPFAFLSVQIGLLQTIGKANPMEGIDSGQEAAIGVFFIASVLLRSRFWNWIFQLKMGIMTRLTGRQLL
jgi:hypothetical protein